MAVPAPGFRDIGLIDRSDGGPTDTPRDTRYDRFMNIYRRAIASFVASMTAAGHEEIAVTVGTLLAEPCASICAAICYPFSYFGFPESYRFDPERLTDAETQRPALFCLHGMLHNRSGWTALGKYLSDREQQFNVYTINLSEDDDEAMDQARARIAEIKAQYAAHAAADPTIHFIGHSRGGWLATRLQGEQREAGENVNGRVARIGAPYPTQYPESTCDMIADYDVIVGQHELEHAVAASRRYPVGHLRLLLHVPALRSATRFLLEDPM